MTKAQVYRTVPSEVHAMQWTGGNAITIEKWLAPIGFHEVYPEDAPMPQYTAELWVQANSAWVYLETSEWVLVDSLGAYPCKNEIFVVKYKLVK